MTQRESESRWEAVLKPLPADTSRQDESGPAEARHRRRSDEQAAAELRWSLYRDDLTGAWQRRPGRGYLDAAVRGAREAGTTLCVAFFDVDNLKRVNDHFGHRRGDQLLAAVGSALDLGLREEDLVVRYGGDEFVCALPRLTSEQARKATDRVARILDGLIPGATVSAGCAELRAEESLDDLIGRADADLYDRRRSRRGGERDGGERDGEQEGSAQAGQAAPAILCGACSEPISLVQFASVDGRRTTRAARCRRCGQRTIIALA